MPVDCGRAHRDPVCCFLVLRIDIELFVCDYIRFTDVNESQANVPEAVNSTPRNID